jgi:hypothetical protein
MSRKFQFVLNATTEELLEHLRDRTERETLTDVIKDALRAYAWIVSEYEQGREVLSQAVGSSATPYRPVFGSNRFISRRAGQ